jgi:hypothetical protein
MQCTVCQEVTTSRCSGCSTQPYCGRSCQAKDWNNHKQACKLQKIEKMDKTVYRVGDILQEIMFLYREKTWDHKIESIEHRGTELHVVEDLPYPYTTGGCMHPFPRALVTNESDKRALLSMYMGIIYHVMFYDMLKEIFQGKKNMRMGRSRCIDLELQIRKSPSMSSHLESSSPRVAQ